MHTTYLSPEDIRKKPFFHIVRYEAPQADQFSKRADRFKTLAGAEQTDWQHYLLLMSKVCEVQHQLAASLPQLDLFDAPKQEENSRLRNLVERLRSGRAKTKTEVLPQRLREPLDAAFLARHGALFGRLLTELCEAISPELPQQSRQQLLQLRAQSEAQRLALAEDALLCRLSEAHRDSQLWLHAVLQVLFSNAAQLLHEDILETDSLSGFCPACGSDAASAVIRHKGEEEGLRYMHCPTCGSQWHVIRNQCSFCAHTGQLEQIRLEVPDHDALAAVQAECCGHCGTYRKSFLLAKNQHLDPIADDLATLALDIKVSEETDFQRGGANPFLPHA